MTVRRDGDALVFTGALAREAVPSLWRALPVDMTGVRCLDLGAVDRLDSAGLALLSTLSMRVRGGMTVLGNPPGLSALRMAYRLTDTLAISTPDPVHDATHRDGVNMTRSTLSQAVVTTLTLLTSACAHAAGGLPPQHPGAATHGARDAGAMIGAVADPAGPAPPMASEPYDPWEKYNRRVYAFNVVIDRIVAKPLARTYAKIVPEPARNGVSHFFDNLNQPVNIVNALLQGKGKMAAQATGRFALNTTVGIGGIFDPATRVHIPNHREDLGQTLGVWGWKHSRYLELPLFGPSTVRDALGMAGNAPLSPLKYVGNAHAVLLLRGLQLADLRTRLFPLDNMLIGAADDYALVRDSWWQRREYRIFEDSDAPHDHGEQPLPDYLREDDSGPVTPNDVKPTIPGH